MSTELRTTNIGRKVAVRVEDVSFLKCSNNVFGKTLGDGALEDVPLLLPSAHLTDREVEAHLVVLRDTVVVEREHGGVTSPAGVEPSLSVEH